MARGWESKSVEAQIDAAEVHRSAVLQNVRSPEELDAIRQRESLIMSRTRVLRELETARNPRYREILKKALAGLDAKLGSVAH
jgi:hypothetical protein